MLHVPSTSKTDTPVLTDAIAVMGCISPQSLRHTHPGKSDYLLHLPSISQADTPAYPQRALTQPIRESWSDKNILHIRAYSRPEYRFYFSIVSFMPYFLHLYAIFSFSPKYVQLCSTKLPPLAFSSFATSSRCSCLIRTISLHLCLTAKSTSIFE